MFQLFFVSKIKLEREVINLPSHKPCVLILLLRFLHYSRQIFPDFIKNSPLFISNGSKTERILSIDFVSIDT